MNFFINGYFKIILAKKSQKKKNLVIDYNKSSVKI